LERDPNRVLTLFEHGQGFIPAGAIADYPLAVPDFAAILEVELLRRRLIRGQHRTGKCGAKTER
jgi:hypothetical protein